MGLRQPCGGCFKKKRQIIDISACRWLPPWSLGGCFNQKMVKYTSVGGSSIMNLSEKKKNFAHPGGATDQNWKSENVQINYLLPLLKIQNVDWYILRAIYILNLSSNKSECKTYRSLARNGWTGQLVKSQKLNLLKIFLTNHLIRLWHMSLDMPWVCCILVIHSTMGYGIVTMIIRINSWISPLGKLNGHLAMQWTLDACIHDTMILGACQVRDKLLFRSKPL